MTKTRHDKAAVRALRHTARLAMWLVAIAVPVIAGGIVGGPVGGVVTAALIIPSLDHLLGPRATRPETRGPGAASAVRAVPVDDDGMRPVENVPHAA